MDIISISDYDSQSPSQKNGKFGIRKTAAGIALPDIKLDDLDKAETSRKKSSGSEGKFLF